MWQVVSGMVSRVTGPYFSEIRHRSGAPLRGPCRTEILVVRYGGQPAQVAILEKQVASLEKEAERASPGQEWYCRAQSAVTPDLVLMRTGR